MGVGRRVLAWLVVLAVAVLAGRGAAHSVRAETAHLLSRVDPAIKDGIAVPTLVLQLGDDLAAGSAERVVGLLEAASQWPIVRVGAYDQLPVLDAGSLVLACGKTNTTDAYITQTELDALAPESFILRCTAGAGNATVCVTRGNPNHIPRRAFNASLGTGYGTYALLESLGFAFLHPLEPYIPPTLVAPTALPINRVEEPYWVLRAWHLHTQHPLELTDLLNGFDITTNGSYQESFESMLPQWDLYLEWMVANRQNEVEWILLKADSWASYAVSAERQARLREITDRCHLHGIACGVDAPLALKQQHSFVLVSNVSTLEAEIEEMHANLDYLMGANFDFLGTENGFSEFQKGSCTRMLAWMDEATRYLGDVYNRELGIKVHITSGQFCEEFPDPITGEPINFNFLPIFADPRLLIWPHTVQMYSFGDPAPTYGQSNFDFMYEFMYQQIAAQERPVGFYPETSYWVNYDIEVPLFLPVYAYQRLRDLRGIAREEIRIGAKMDGQNVFDSGWEWGYWLQGVIAARASWNPHMEVADDADAYQLMLAEVLRPLAPSTAVLDEWVDLLVELSLTQRAQLIFGEVDGVRPADVVKRNGIAYLEGWDTFAEVGSLFESFLNTQPSRLQILEVLENEVTDPTYDEIAPLLAAMRATYRTAADRLDALRSSFNPAALSLFDDHADSAQVTAARADQVDALYAYAASWQDGITPARIALQRRARDDIDVAETYIRHHEERYRTPLERIAGWRYNPTAYRHTYLWTTKTLYYFWRDFDKATLPVRTANSVCYMNIINPADVGLGEGALYNLTQTIRDTADANRPGPHWIIDCMAAPAAEPSYPLNP